MLSTLVQWSTIIVVMRIKLTVVVVVEKLRPNHFTPIKILTFRFLNDYLDYD